MTTDICEQVVRSVASWFKPVGIVEYADIIQSGMLGLLAATQSGIPCDDVGYARRCVRNSIIDTLQRECRDSGGLTYRQKKRISRPLDLADEGFLLGNKTAKSNGRWPSYETDVTVRELMSGLCDTQAAVLRLEFWYGLTRPEIALLLNKTPLAITRIRERAMANLRQKSAQWTS